ncbi:hypothetical protein [Halorubrum distributum]|uniref:hypothetical protein n=1 Tax=Halorubrum distributum TaxID=29283 RepID=UPI001266F37E|nr:hypothetical protein [Halorubrum litoreum]
MIGISISLYDKFDDLGILVDIIRENWEGNYFISVCSNHPEAEDRIADLNSDIDSFQQGADIKYDSSMDDFRRSANLKYRVFNTIRTAVRGAIAADVDYVMHLHADAWQLSEEKLQQLIQDMKERNAAVAFKGRTNFFQDRYTPGHFSDQFIIYDAQAANSVDLFEREAMDFPPQYVIHQILPMICLVKFGWEKLYHYSTRSEEEHWDGTPILEVRNPARPMLYNPKYEQLHIATEDFSNDLGKSLQAYYLQKHNITDGYHIKKLNETYSISKDDLFRQIENYFDSMDKKLRWYGLSVDSFGRNVNHIEPFLEKSLFGKLKTVPKLHAKTAAEIALNKFLDGTETDPAQSVHQLYANRLDPDDYPENFSDTIYKKDN